MWKNNFIIKKEKTEPVQACFVYRVTYGDDLNIKGYFEASAISKCSSV